MTIKALIEFFETFQNVPVEILDVRDHIVESLGVEDEIILHPENLSADILGGMLVRFTKREAVYAQVTRCALVIYDANAPIEHQRLACCKELVHLFDVPSLSTNTRDAIIRLINNLTMGFDIGVLHPGDHHALKDKIALFQALAVLFPHELREDLMPLYKDGKIDSHWIAEYLCIPEEYVDFLMSDGWDPFRRILLEV